MSTAHNNTGNFHQNSGVAGLGGFGAAGTIPPPIPFMGLHQPPLSTFPMSPAVFPPMLPTSDPRQKGQYGDGTWALANDGTLHAVDPAATAASGYRDDSGREEGEVSSDMDGQKLQPAKKSIPGELRDPALNIGSARNTSSQRPEHPGTPSHEIPGNRDMDIEETSLKSRASSRDSGSRITHITSFPL